MCSTKHLEAIIYAIEEALNGDMHSMHGCVIMKNRKIISSGFNIGHEGIKSTTSIGNKWSVHAERMAFNNVKNREDLRGATLYVIRIKPVTEKKDGLFYLSISKPCLKCSKLINKMIENYGLKGVYYSTTNKNILIKIHEDNIIILQC